MDEVVREAAEVTGEPVRLGDVADGLRRQAALGAGHHPQPGPERCAPELFQLAAAAVEDRIDRCPVAGGPQSSWRPSAGRHSESRSPLSVSKTCTLLGSVVTWRTCPLLIVLRPLTRMMTFAGVPSTPEVP